MSLEDFQLFDNEPIDNSILKRDYIKIHHQQGAQLNNPDQNIEFIFGEINNYHQIGNSYLQFDITVRNPAISAMILLSDYIKKLLLTALRKLLFQQPEGWRLKL